MYFKGLFYEVKGTGYPIILVHGIGGSNKSFEPQIKELSKYFKTISIDLKGSGNSDSSTGESTYLDTHTESIYELMNELNIDQANFIGLSYGGIVTQSFAIRYQERVSKMILIDTYARVNKKEYPILLFAFSIFITSWFPKGVQKALFKKITLYKGHKLAQNDLMNLVESRRAKEVTRQLVELLGFDFSNELKKIETPTLVMAGDKHSAITDKSREIASLIPESEFVEIKNAFDPSNLCQPSKVNTEILHFIKEQTMLKIKENA